MTFSEFKLLLEDYIFCPEINSEEEYLSAKDKEIEYKIIHKDCQHKFYVTLKDFLNKRPIMVINKETIHLKNKNDSFCPNCVKMAKNKYISYLVKNKFNDEFILKSDYINMGEKLKFFHKECEGTFEIKAYDLIRLKTKLKCPCCKDLLTRSEKKKQKDLEKLKDKFDFSKNISSNTVFKEYLNKESSIYHKKCKRTSEITLSEFLKFNKGSLSYLYKYVEDMEDLKCPHCKQEAKNDYFSEILKIKTDDMFELAQDFNLLAEKIKIRHKIFILVNQ